MENFTSSIYKELTISLEDYKTLKFLTNIFNAEINGNDGMYESGNISIHKKSELQRIKEKFILDEKENTEEEYITAIQVFEKLEKEFQKYDTFSFSYWE